MQNKPNSNEISEKNNQFIQQEIVIQDNNTNYLLKNQQNLQSTIIIEDKDFDIK